MKIEKDGKIIETTERVFNMVYKDYGYSVVGDPSELPFTDLDDSMENEPDVPEPIELRDLNELRVSELKDIAKWLEIEGYSELKKEELVEVLEGE